VQSSFFVQSRTVCVPEQVLPSDVAQTLGETQRVVMPPVVQLGTVPPVIGILPQHTSEEGQSPGALHAAPEPRSAAASVGFPVPVSVVATVPESVALESDPPVVSVSDPDASVCPRLVVLEPQPVRMSIETAVESCVNRILVNYHHPAATPVELEPTLLAMERNSGAVYGCRSSRYSCS
jgi:hypothetical protein